MNRGAARPSRRTVVDIAELLIESDDGINERAIAAAINRQLARAGLLDRTAAPDGGRVNMSEPSDPRIGDSVARAISRDLP